MTEEEIEQMRVNAQAGLDRGNPIRSHDVLALCNALTAERAKAAALVDALEAIQKRCYGSSYMLASSVIKLCSDAIRQGAAPPQPTDEERDDAG